MTFLTARSSVGMTAFMGLTAILCATGCDVLGPVASLLGNPGVNVEIKNDTAFFAVPDLRTAGSRNFIEDAFADDEAVGGPVAPNQTVSIFLPCDGDLERIVFDGARFQDAGGFALGDSDTSESLRRDVDFDCGDTINIRLSGTVFFFRSSLTVDNTGRDIFGGSNLSGDGDDEDDIGDLIDDILGS